MNGLKPFWRYYGGKWRAAPRYPKPKHQQIIEPFAGAAGYSLRYPDHDVLLIEKYPTICEIWRYLIAVSAEEILRIPEVEDVDDLPTWVPQGGRWLVGFTMNSACSTPRKTLSTGRKQLRAKHRQYEGWSPAVRNRVASQVDHIRHWRVIEGEYWCAPHVEATWFVDPPYDNKAGSYYVHSKVDRYHLGLWCRSRLGQTIVCENEGATWLPFRPFATFKPGVNGNGSKEVIWTQDTKEQP